MSDLIAIAYPDTDAAKRALDNLAKKVEDGILEVDDVVMIAADGNGFLIPFTKGWGVVPGAMGGAVAGGLIGLVLLGPLLGIAAGGVLGGRAGYKRTSQDHGISDEFLVQLWDHLQPGTAAVVMLAREVDYDAALAHVHEPGHAIQTTLGAELDARLTAALEAAGD